MRTATPASSSRAPKSLNISGRSSTPTGLARPLAVKARARSAREAGGGAQRARQGRKRQRRRLGKRQKRRRRRRRLPCRGYSAHIFIPCNPATVRSRFSPRREREASRLAGHAANQV